MQGGRVASVLVTVTIICCERAGAPFADFDAAGDKSVLMGSPLIVMPSLESCASKMRQRL